MRRLSESEIRRIERLSNPAVSPILEKSKGKNMDVNILHSTDVENVVDNPQHYKHGTFEVIDEMIMVFGPARTYDFCIMNAWKYRSRALYKGNAKQDMDKADRYLQMAKQIADKNPNVLCLFNLIMPF